MEDHILSPFKNICLLLDAYGTNVYSFPPMSTANHYCPIELRVMMEVFHSVLSMGLESI